ncbi:hypothetical protein AVEN_2278-1 [Araneus ventricosus]|uniref:Uncharacterized protein n=1 Tax=Araneus ventricosus TaxID=182803 RepID=A0A4Y2FNU8_ARAVE|nr:hypothetical protein AVEN_2278-1 [Araneus ventricosus]
MPKRTYEKELTSLVLHTSLARGSFTRNEVTSTKHQYNNLWWNGVSNLQPSGPQTKLPHQTYTEPLLFKGDYYITKRFVPVYDGILACKPFLKTESNSFSHERYNTKSHTR